MDKLEINKKMILVEPELMQTVLNLLTILPFNQVHKSIQELLKLKVYPIKEFTCYEVEDNITK